MINKGQVCSPGGIANPDAKNLNRLNGSSVDIGAYEQGSGAVTGMILVGDNNSNNQSGTAGADILCGYGGQDLQSGADGNDYIDGGDQNDLQLGGTGADRMFGGKGNDRLCANDGTGTDSIDGGKGTDSYKVDTGDVKKAVETALASCFI